MVAAASLTLDALRSGSPSSLTIFLGGIAPTKQTRLDMKVTPDAAAAALSISPSSLSWLAGANGPQAVTVKVTSPALWATIVEYSMSLSMTIVTEDNVYKQLPLPTILVHPLDDTCDAPVPPSDARMVVASCGGGSARAAWGQVRPHAHTHTPTQTRTPHTHTPHTYKSCLCGAALATSTARMSCVGWLLASCGNLWCPCCNL